MSQVQAQTFRRTCLRFAAVLAFLTTVLSPAMLTAQCTSTTQADVVALDQVYFWNRLGAVEPQGMVFALLRDIVPINTTIGIAPGNVQLRSDKRPRPLVLRVNAGSCLQINFRNLLNSAKPDKDAPSTRTASVHATGMQLVGSIASDGSNVGANTSSLVSPGGTATYTFFAEHEGGYLMYSAAATTGGEGNGGSISAGLFGAIMVEPAGAEYYRSQVTADDLFYATTGTTTDGHPIINYAAVYPATDPRTGLALPAIKAGHPVLKMIESGKIIYSDLNAIITGPSAGRFAAGTYVSTPVNPDRLQPFREFSVIFHDEVGAFQAFHEFRDTLSVKTFQSVKDGFAINYGTGGIGAEILANRFGVGPMWQCTECKYEEFFLSAWAVGDPAMVVDVPANVSDALGNVIPGPKASKAFYPDDPSNVHHSYIGDHVKFRNIHAGPKEHHIFHLHAHQWVNTPDSDNSTYLDSQAIGPGAAFTYEITYNGSGNRNKTVGDAIFHCHFYPHFAQGMWELWRSHDVFEAGTKLDANGKPAAGSRAYPDGEILVGTPIPALVPMPTLAMAPMPGASVQVVNGQAVIQGSGNPGYPFFVPAVAGHRPPHPPMDTIDDGGLPRHIITGGTFNESHTLLDFHKRLLSVVGRAVPEAGTAVEQAAMNYHAIRNHPSFLPNGTPGNFVTNGLPPAPGAPFADPCVDDNGNATGHARTYKAADIQLADIKFNKAGWHFGQQRMLSLWGDVASFMNGSKPPEPFFFRANTGDCISYYLTNLVPNEYLQDDFQVRTPTDILGQHIHLVKFDVTSSDGSGNGWNYEDGTFSNQEVLERINAINNNGGMIPVTGSTLITLSAKPHPFFTNIVGAQTSIQRWYADPTLNNAGVDRTLRTVFTHDHFGPSSHQQIGLYAGLVVEPAGATWRNPEDGTFMGSRFDGGPTSWHVDVLTANQADSYREFMLEFADFQHAYRPDGTPVNPPDRAEVGLPLIVKALPTCSNGTLRPCPEAIAADDVGTMVVNYRNEPVALRVRDPLTNTQALDVAGDLSHVFRSNVTRADPALNVQPSFYPPLTPGVQPGDPYTPLLRAYESDHVQVRVLVGATEEGHNFSVDGAVKWLFEPSDPNSGWRSNQMMGISEHFEFLLPSVSSVNGNAPYADIIYKPGTSQDDLWNGLWGLFRVYNGGKGILPDLKPLPSNPTGNTKTNGTNPGSFSGVCPNTAYSRKISVSAIPAAGLPGGTLVYNSRTNMNGPLHDPTAILYVRDSDLDKNFNLKSTVPVEPLVLRANAGDCLQITLTNRLPQTLPDLAGFNTLPMIVTDFNSNQILPSSEVGLRPQLLDHYYSDDGQNVGFNATRTALPANNSTYSVTTVSATGVDSTATTATTGDVILSASSGGNNNNPNTFVTYTWYAGTININPDGSRTAVPMEFGAVNLLPSDPIKQANKGAIGALIIEPVGATWVEDASQRASATVTKADGTTFRDFALQFQNGVNLRYGDGTAVPVVALEEDPEDSGHKALNYRSEPFWKRMNYAPETPLNGGHGGTGLVTTDMDFTNVLSNSLIGSDPVTPIFTAKAGTPVRFRLFMGGGPQRNNVFNLHGHIWQQEPYNTNSTVIGFNPLSEWKGTLFGIGAGSHFELVPMNGAGGKFKIPGDYLFRTQQSFQFDGGLWGIFRVAP